MDKSKILKKIKYYFPELVALCVCVAFLLGDISQKQGYHMDELLSFELANAEFNPWIVPTQPQGRLAKYVENELRGENVWETLTKLMDTVKDVAHNRGGSRLLSYTADVYDEPVWIESERFRDYITVGEHGAFNYLSVYFNVKDDNHPPLHFMTLHTISSIFKRKISPIMGCGINLVCVIGVMILLMRIGKQLPLLGFAEDGSIYSKEYCRMAGTWAAWLYGLSAGASSTTLLIRMYAMVTFFCVALLAIHLNKLRNEWTGGSGFEKGNKMLLLVTVLGFWTQYFFLFYCIILAAVTAIILWRKGRRKELWRYVRTMVLAAFIGITVFPFAISDVFSSGRGVEALGALSSGFSGYGSRIGAFGRIVFERMGILCTVVLALVLLLCVLFVIVKNVKKHANKENYSESKSAEQQSERKLSAYDLTAVLCIPPLGYFLLAARMSPYLVDRYVMPVFPFAMLIMVAAVCIMWNKAFNILTTDGKARKIFERLLVCLTGVTFLCQLWNPMRYTDSYLYKGYDAQRIVSENYAGYPCICIYEGVGYYENLTEFVNYGSTLLVTEQELNNRAETESITSLDQVVILLKRGSDMENICKVLEEKYGLHCQEILVDTGAPYGDTIFLCGTGDS